MKVLISLLIIFFSYKNAVAHTKIIWIKNPFSPIYKKNQNDGIGDTVQKKLEKCLDQYQHETKILSNQLRVMKTLQVDSKEIYCNPLLAKRTELASDLAFSVPITFTPDPKLIVLQKNKKLFLKGDSSRVELKKLLLNSKFHGLFNASAYLGQDINELIRTNKKNITSLYKNNIAQQIKLLNSGRNDYLIGYPFVFNQRENTSKFTFLPIKEHAKRFHGVTTCNKTESTPKLMLKINKCIKGEEFKEAYKRILSKYFPKHFRSLLIP